MVKKSRSWFHRAMKKLFFWRKREVPDVAERWNPHTALETAMPIRLTLIRHEFTDKSTIGTLYLDGEKICDTLEDHCRRNKIYGVTAIPSGTYELAINYSNRFKKYLPMLLNVPFFRGIRIHCGNRHEDTEGCILIGDNIDDINDLIVNSRKTMSRVQPILEKALKEGKIYLKISGGYSVDDMKQIEGVGA